MKSGRLERAALIAEIIGGTAVVISVIYLALQISDNNRLLRSQAHYNALEVLQHPLEVMLESDSLADSLFQCDYHPREVSDSLWTRCSNYYLMQLNGWEYTFYQNIDETLPPELWMGVTGYLGIEVQSKAGYARFWEESSIAFGDPFHSYVEEYIQRNSAFRRLSD